MAVRNATAPIAQCASPICQPLLRLLQKKARSQSENKLKALKRLRLAIALRVRKNFPLAASPFPEKSGNILSRMHRFKLTRKTPCIPWHAQQRLMHCIWQQGK